MDLRVLWIWFHFVFIQCVTDHPNTKSYKNDSSSNDDDNTLTNLGGLKKYVVYPRLYHMSKRKKRFIDTTNDVDLLLVLPTEDKTFYVELYRNKELREVPVTVREEDNRTPETEVHTSDCLYHGTVLNHPGGVAAMSFCSEDGTMGGTLLTSEGVYVLHPDVENLISTASTDEQNTSPHFLYQKQDDVHFCGVGENNSLHAGDEDRMTKGRQKRADTSKRKVMEVAIFVDSALYTKLESISGKDVRTAIVQQVLAIMNQVQIIYNYATLDTKFKIVVVKLEILKPTARGPDTARGNIDNYLDNFCNWQSKLNVREGNTGHWDHAIMLTGLDLYKEYGGMKNTKVLGLAWVNGMCRSNYSCTLNEGSNFEAAFVIAHEMGHNLGIMHDGSGNNCDRNKYIMSDKTGPGKVNWSPCSNVYIKRFFRSGFGWCLEDDASPPNRSYDLNTQSLPGSKYSLADQCALALGASYLPYQNTKEPFNNVCKELWCASGTWAKPAHPALEGSPCGTKKACVEGSCKVSKIFSRTTTTTTAMPRRTTASLMRRSRPAGIETEQMDWIQQSVLKMIQAMG